MSQKLWLPSHFASGMVLQQQVPSLLHGRTRPGATVRLQLERAPFDGRPVSALDGNYGLVADVSTTSDKKGAFSLEIPSFPASLDPFTLRLSDGQESRTLDGLLFGEVWVTGGESNMQMPMGAVAETAQMPLLANLHYIRVLQQSETGLGPLRPAYSYDPAEDVNGARWLRGDQPDLIQGVSAIAFSFARELHLELRLPVAVIETAIAGSHIHAWLERESIESHSAIRQHIKNLGFYRGKADWNTAGDLDWASNQPAALFNSKIFPLRGLAARGVLWYHGESDYRHPAYYQSALTALLKSWQKIFPAADERGLVFLYTQLAPHYYGHQRFCQLAEFNEMLAAARHKLNVPAGLVTLYDQAPLFADAPAFWRHPIRPTVKMPIGSRLKTVALGLAYHRKAPLTAPECSDIEIVGNKMLLSFSHIGDGLRLRGEDSRVRGFALCGPDRVFVEAQARILYGLRVLVWHDQISEPQAVSYAFADMNSYANLISRDHLPVVPFRSDRESSAYLPPQEWVHCDDLRIWSCPRLARPEETGWHEAWRIVRGIGDLQIEKANKSEGEGSLYFRYHSADAAEFAVEPALQDDSMFPPLDLSHYGLLSVDVFNADTQTKHLRLALAYGDAAADLQTLPGRVTILPALRWQRLQFDLRCLDESCLAAIRRLVFIVEDHRGKGAVYLDQIRLLRP